MLVATTHQIPFRRKRCRYRSMHRMKASENTREEAMMTEDAEARARIRSFLPPITMMVLSIPLLLNVLPRNWMYGVRTRETMASDAAWVAGNRLGAITLIAASAIWILAAIYLPRPYVKPVGIAAVLLAFAVLFVTQGWSI